MWWFYTVVLGMSFAQILQELAVAVREWTRQRRPFLPAVLWQVFLLTLVVQVWLAVTYYRTTVARVSILELLAFLSVPAAILIMSFLLPQAQGGEAGNGEAGNDEAGNEFSRVRPVFFGVLIAMVAVNLLHGFAIGQQGWDADLLFQCLLVAGATAGLFLHRRRADVALAIAMIGVVATYIVVSYSTVAVDGTL